MEGVLVVASVAAPPGWVQRRHARVVKLRHAVGDQANHMQHFGARVPERLELGAAFDGAGGVGGGVSGGRAVVARAAVLGDVIEVLAEIPETAA